MPLSPLQYLEPLCLTLTYNFRNILLVCLFAVIWRWWQQRWYVCAHAHECAEDGSKEWWRQQRWYVCVHARECVEAGSKKTILEVGPIIHPVGSGVQTQVLQH